MDSFHGDGLARSTPSRVNHADSSLNRVKHQHGRAVGHSPEQAYTPLAGEKAVEIFAHDKRRCLLIVEVGLRHFKHIGIMPRNRAEQARMARKRCSDTRIILHQGGRVIRDCRPGIECGKGRSADSSLARENAMGDQTFKLLEDMKLKPVNSSSSVLFHVYLPRCNTLHVSKHSIKS